MIRILFFAKLREALGCHELEWPVTEPVKVSAVREQLIKKHPAWEEVLCAPNVLTALNQEVVSLESQVNPGDELAFYPPVTGG
ncbi:molybdopterin synthase sulfur carrier subunit [Litorivivens lipolytica]|uniref:Molybdopterin synthase sulfur carrier subunit n=1 Tax=Litorivivens lipolytica TaxID=1524264 RepID=A0A7W4W3A7_9GAMM|nr:MoaD/ThiS family protein [Litorivivens lipolytica]MBB3046661.1 molybdopterin synthase sulfur carrier subunit [Litorivivens lipolytica]